MLRKVCTSVKDVTSARHSLRRIRNATEGKNFVLEGRRFRQIKIWSGNSIHELSWHITTCPDSFILLRFVSSRGMDFTEISTGFSLVEGSILPANYRQRRGLETSKKLSPRSSACPIIFAKSQTLHSKHPT